MLKQIISGGQTGADQGGLEGAYLIGIKTGGVAPKGYRTNAGYMPELLRDKYGLEESPFSSYPPRTEANVRRSDGTVWVGRKSPGYWCTKRAVAKLSFSQSYHWLENPTPEDLAKWVADNGIEILNVAGNREETNLGIYDRTKALIVQAFGDHK